MSTPEMSIGTRIENILRQEAETGVPGEVNIWPRVLEAGAAVQTGKTDANFGQKGRAHAPVRNIESQRLKTRKASLHQRNWLYVATGLVVMVLVAISVIAVLSVASLMNPAPVSAVQILAQAEAAAEHNSTGDVHSTHAIVAVRFRNDPADPFAETQSEWWDQAPDKSRTLSTYRNPDNSESWAVLGKVGNTRYMYTSGEKTFHIDAVKRPATTVGTDINTTTAEASSVGPFTAYDAVLTGTEYILGRKTYVLDLTLKGNGGKVPNQFTVPQYRKQVWVDAESYLILQEYDWNREGILLYESTCRKLEINPTLDAHLFEFSPPEGYRVVDTRTTPAPSR